MSWGLIKSIDKEYLNDKYGQMDYSKLEYLLIDEFAVRKGHVYMTVVWDPIGKRALYVGEGRDQNCLNEFWENLKKSGAKIKAIAMDMSASFIAMAKKYVPEIPIVFDKFHIVQMVGKALSDLRKLAYREEKDLNKRKLIKGTNWLLLKRKEKLSTTLGKDEELKLLMALEVNKSLAIGYYLKEDLRQIWDQPNKEEGEKQLNVWCKMAEASKIQPLKKVAATLKSHRTGILNFFDHQISTGPLEGFNNKIKVLKRNAYGYRDNDYFRLKILGLHDARYVLL